MANVNGKPKGSAKRKVNRKLDKVRLALFILFAIVVVQQVYTIYSLHQEKHQLEQQLQELKKENENLSEQKKL